VGGHVTFGEQFPDATLRPGAVVAVVAVWTLLAAGDNDLP
jgi:hypothetical protein